MLLGGAGLCLWAILALAPGGSRAAFPGANGDIVFSRQTGPILKPKDPRPGGIFTVAPNGKDVTRVTTGDDDDPGFSPNGKWIVFTRRSDKPGLYRIKADGSRPEAPDHRFGRRQRRLLPRRREDRLRAG